MADGGWTSRHGPSGRTTDVGQTDERVLVLTRTPRAVVVTKGRTTRISTAKPKRCHLLPRVSPVLRDHRRSHTLVRPTFVGTVLFGPVTTPPFTPIDPPLHPTHEEPPKGDMATGRRVPRVFRLRLCEGHWESLSGNRGWSSP